MSWKSHQVNITTAIPNMKTWKNPIIFERNPFRIVSSQNIPPMIEDHPPVGFPHMGSPLLGVEKNI